mmetsp:Transcript_48677/g.156349  ORF Transcript_48677/g.156349 Transcript_48677/m.156349 type:complete len:352 (+) Transcript_48677:554-1609(+)
MAHEADLPLASEADLRLGDEGEEKWPTATSPGTTDALRKLGSQDLLCRGGSCIDAQGRCRCKPWPRARSAWPTAASTEAHRAASPDLEDAPRWMQELLRVRRGGWSIQIVAAWKRLPVSRLLCDGLEVPSFDHLQPLEHLGGHVSLSVTRMAVWVPVGDEVFEEPGPARQGLLPGDAQAVGDLTQDGRLLRAALGDDLPAGHADGFGVRRRTLGVGHLPQWPALHAVEGRLEDVLAARREHATGAEEGGGVRVSSGYRHVVSSVVAVHLEVIEGAATEVHVDLRVVEQHLDDVAGAVLGGDHQRGDLLEEDQGRVGDRPRVLAHVDVVGVGAPDFQNLPNLHHVVLRRHIQ